MLYKEDWENLSTFGDTLLLDRVIIYDREAARRTPENAKASKVLEDIARIKGSEDWWEPMRKSVVAAATGGRGGLRPPKLPVITYVSRQHADKRRFKAEQHEHLLKGLEQLAVQGHVEVNVVEWETMSRQNQIAIASQTTVRPFKRIKYQAKKFD